MSNMVMKLKQEQAKIQVRILMDHAVGKSLILFSKFVGFASCAGQDDFGSTGGVR